MKPCRARLERSAGAPLEAFLGLLGLERSGAFLEAFLGLFGNMIHLRLRERHT